MIQINGDRSGSLIFNFLKIRYKQARLRKISIKPSTARAKALKWKILSINILLRTEKRLNKMMS